MKLQSTTRGGVRTAVALIACALLTAVVALPAAGAGGAVTAGTVEPFADAGALGETDVTGTAVLVRAADRTIVRVRLAGLAPGATYGSHVHNQACGDGDAGGHYRFAAPVPGGAWDGTEIWPGPLTANAAGHATGVAKVGAVAGPEAVSVVVHAPVGQKIACADLR